MKKTKILALALAGALACPQVAFAAEDDSGMQYTSASEGLFGSLRTRFNTGNTKNANTVIEADGSVFGYRGTLDLGNGMTGIYHYEQRILAHDGEGVGQDDLNGSNDKGGDARFNFVGVRGAFGEVNFGSHGAFVAGVPNVTDVTANGGGNFVPFYRRGRSIQYVSPELNGFQAGGHIQMTGGSDTTTPGKAICKEAPGAAANQVDRPLTGDPATALGSCPAGAPTADFTAPTHGDPNVKQWAIAGVYKVRGFRVGGTYIVDPEAWNNAAAGTDFASRAGTLGTTEDATTWFVSGKYAQDNWAVAAMHGQKNTSDNPNQIAIVANSAANHDSRKWHEDETYTSLSGNVTVGKVGLAVLHDIRSDHNGIAGRDTTVTAFSATYNFTSRSRVWAAYIANDDDTKDNEKDQITIGMRMDF